MKTKIIDIVDAMLIGIMVGIITELITGLIVMWLWNWLMPVIFGLAEITYIQGWGLSFLCGMLFRTTSRNTKEN